MVDSAKTTFNFQPTKQRGPMLDLKSDMGVLCPGHSLEIAKAFSLQGTFCSCQTFLREHIQRMGYMLLMAKQQHAQGVRTCALHTQ